MSFFYYLKVRHTGCETGDRVELSGLDSEFFHDRSLYTYYLCHVGHGSVEPTREKLEAVLPVYSQDVSLRICAVRRQVVDGRVHISFFDRKMCLESLRMPTRRRQAQ